MTDSLILSIHAGATLFMAGLIWFVQVVHYPLFARVGTDSFTTYEQDHTRLTTYVVAPVMLVEFTTAVWLAIVTPQGIDAWLPWAGLGMLAAIWLSTAFLQVPMHRRLTQSFSEKHHRFLVRGNWLRTVLWSARGVLALWMIVATA